MTSQTETGLSTVPWRSTTLHVVLASSLIGVMGVSLISPVLPDLRGVFGVSDAQVGLVITAYTLPGIVVTPFVGLAADRLGRRRVLVPLLFTFGIAGAGIAFVDSFAAVLALRFLQGLGASALVTLAITLVGDVYEGTRRDAVMGLNGSTIGTGAALYPLIGGALATIRWSTPFLFFGIAMLVGLVAALALEEPETDRSTGTREYLRGLRGAMVDPRALAIYGTVLVVFFVFYGAVLTAVPLLLSDDFGLSSDRIGLVLAMVSVASATVSSQYGRIAARFDPKELVAIGFCCYGTGLLLVSVAPTPTLVGASLLVFGMGFGVVMPSIDTAVVTMVSSRLRAGMMGLRTSVLRLGQTLGPVGFTATAEAFFPTTAAGYRVLIPLTGVVVVTMGLVGLVALKR